jgi:hypothetical protein
MEGASAWRGPAQASAVKMLGFCRGPGSLCDAFHLSETACLVYIIQMVSLVYLLISLCVSLFGPIPFMFGGEGPLECMAIILPFIQNVPTIFDALAQQRIGQWVCTLIPYMDALLRPPSF